MIVVYFESGTHAEVVAKFANEEVYLACFPILEEMAKGQRMVVTESVQDEGGM